MNFYSSNYKKMNKFNQNSYLSKKQLILLIERLSLNRMTELIIIIIIKYLVIVSALITVISISPINTIVALVATFFIRAILLIYLDIVYFAILILIVYIGAISVPSPSAIMLINTKFLGKDISFIKYSIISIIMITNLIHILFTNTSISFKNNILFEITKTININRIKVLHHKSNIEAIAFYSYEWLNISFIIAGLILSIGLIGAIISTKNSK